MMTSLTLALDVIKRGHYLQENEPDWIYCYFRFKGAHAQERWLAGGCWRVSGIRRDQRRIVTLMHVTNFRFSFHYGCFASRFLLRLSISWNELWWLNGSVVVSVVVSGGCMCVGGICFLWFIPPSYSSLFSVDWWTKKSQRGCFWNVSGDCQIGFHAALRDVGRKT